MNHKYHPPTWAKNLLDFFIRSDFADEIIGDLSEAFYWRLEQKGSVYAKSRFIWEVLTSLRPANLKSFHYLFLNTMILRNYLTIAWRNLRNGNSSSLINLFGLSIGVAAFIIIFLYTYPILSFDQHHEQKDHIFMVYKERITPNGTQATYDTWLPLKDKLLEDYDQITHAARYFTTNAKVHIQQRYIEESIAYTDASLFDIFSFPLLHGNPSHLFPTANSVVLDVATAQKYFHTDNPIGQTMEIFLPTEDTTMQFQVSAVISHLPENTSLQPSLMIQLGSLPMYSRFVERWSSSFLDTYILLKNQEDAHYMEADFPKLVRSIWGEETQSNTKLKLLPFDSYYDTFIGSKANARMLLWIGLGVLLIAMINFMNLSTAQASRRALEIGLRKVLGAVRGQLRLQFITEAVLTTFFATLIGLGIVLIGLPYINAFFDLHLSITPFSWTTLSIFICLFAMLVGILSGSYPAFYLSSIGIIESLRPKIGINGSITFRNILVIIQFAIALFLISSTIIVRHQLHFMSTQDMGYGTEGIITIDASPYDFVDSEEGLRKLNTFKNALLQKPYINDMTVSRSIPTSWTHRFTFVRPNEWNGDPLRMRYTHVDAQFFPFYDIPISHGRNFLADSKVDQHNTVIINQAAAKAFQFSPDQPNQITIGDRNIEVIGVVADFHFESLMNQVAPTLIFPRAPEDAAHRYISCKMNLSNINTHLSEIEEMWNELGSTQEFTYSFLDDQVAQLYQSERRYLGMVSIFSLISILVACMGLYGLTLFIIERRRKEISIRKLLGAEVGTIVQLIFTDFAKWIMIAFVLSIPMAIYFLNAWLERYYYKVNISWNTFAIALGIVVGLVVLTVGYQTMKAAYANPVTYLKDE